MPESFDNHNHHSVPVQEIMGTMPIWISRWGITILFSILMCVILGCFFIKYPVTLSSSVTVERVSYDQSVEDTLDRKVDSIVLMTDISPNHWSVLETGQDIILRFDSDVILKGKIAIVQSKEAETESFPILTIQVSSIDSLGSRPVALVCGMQGSADIVVQEKRLIDFVFQRKVLPK